MVHKRWEVLINLIHSHNLLIGAEIGVKSGRNITEVLLKCPKFFWYAIDAWDIEMQYQTWPKSAHLVNEIQFNKVLTRFPNNIKKIKDYSLSASKNFTDHSLDLVFIDATHTYKDCKEDIEAWAPKVKLGCWLTGHDYNHPRFPGVTEAVNEAFKNVIVGPDHTWMVRL